MGPSYSSLNELSCAYKLRGTRCHAHILALAVSKTRWYSIRNETMRLSTRKCHLPVLIFGNETSNYFRSALHTNVEIHHILSYKPLSRYMLKARSLQQNSVVGLHHLHNERTAILRWLPQVASEVTFTISKVVGQMEDRD